jgi:hypothetical protein
MEEAAFEAYMSRRNLAPATRIQRMNALKRIEHAWAVDLDVEFERDQLASLLHQLSYSAADQRARLPNPSKIDIESENLVAQLRRYRSHLADYLRFKGGLPIEAEESDGLDLYKLGENHEAKGDSDGDAWSKSWLLERASTLVRIAARTNSSFELMYAIMAAGAVGAFLLTIFLGSTISAIFGVQLVIACVFVLLAFRSSLRSASFLAEVLAWTFSLMMIASVGALGFSFFYCSPAPLRSDCPQRSPFVNKLALTQAEWGDYIRVAPLTPVAGYANDPAFLNQIRLVTAKESENLTRIVAIEQGSGNQNKVFAVLEWTKFNDELGSAYSQKEIAAMDRGATSTVYVYTISKDADTLLRRRQSSDFDKVKGLEDAKRLHLARIMDYLEVPYTGKSLGPKGQ